jgi:hypothetical protein
MTTRAGTRIGVQAKKSSDGSEVFQVRILNAAGDVLWDPTDRVTAVKAAGALYSVLKGHALDGVELKHWIAGE